MYASLCDILVDPVDRGSMAVRRIREDSRGEVVRGSFDAGDGRSYPILDGIPRFVTTRDPGQRQTSDAFAFKWRKRESWESRANRDQYTAWLADKYGFDSADEWSAAWVGRRRILDLGCGAGLSSAGWLDSPRWTGQAMWVGVDISEAIDEARRYLGHVQNAHFVQADALNLPFPDGTFDTILSEGVLHHTPSTREALLSAARVLAPGGEINFYVYRRKGPVREFTDDYIREQIAPMSDEEAWSEMRTLTRLGRALAELRVSVDVPVDVPLLGIDAGEQDVQRLIYWSFAKLYWNEALSFEENVHVNFDWYRPRYAHRQSAEEVRRWCAEAGLAIDRFHRQKSGFTVRAVKD